jgi:HAE1 family hydrophobic/amphiphilic exporter-1
MNISELCIRRPVMVVLLSLSLVVAGLLAYGRIPVAALPSYNTPVINVTADLPGASPETMASSVATPLEKQFSNIAGISVITSTSTQGQTSLTLEFDSSINVDAAAVDVQAALLRAQRGLPPEMTNLPSYRKINPADAPVLFMAMTSPSMNLSELNDYAENLIAPTLSTLPGVAQVSVNGQKRFAVRVRAKPDLLNARDITLDELSTAIRNANTNSPLGVIDGPEQTMTIQANSQMMRADQFADLIVATRNGVPVRLSEVATVEDSYQSVKAAASLNGERSIVLLVQRQPDANTVQVVDAVRKLLPRFEAQLPSSIKIQLVNDRSRSIRDALHDVNLTLGLTVALVLLVIFLFLHRATATMIPAVTLPISLLGAVALLYAFGYSLDNVSLLGITLAVGLVVDDAIVVLENIVRHIELGKRPLEAALIGSREMGFTIVSISISLVAVFIPIFFMPGVIGLLFHEFAVVVSLAILVSAIVSLTLVPMLASRLLPPHDPSQHGEPTWVGRQFERGFTKVRDTYARMLDWSLAHRFVVLMVAIGTFALTAVLYSAIPKGFFPEEDLGQIQVSTESSEDTSSSAMLAKQDRLVEIYRADPNVLHVTSFANGGNTARMFLVLKPRSQRAPLPQVLDRCARAPARCPAWPRTCARCRTCSWADVPARAATSTRCRA